MRSVEYRIMSTEYRVLCTVYSLRAVQVPKSVTPRMATAPNNRGALYSPNAASLPTTQTNPFSHRQRDDSDSVFRRSNLSGGLQLNRGRLN